MCPGDWGKTTKELATDRPHKSTFGVMFQMKHRMGVVDMKKAVAEMTIGPVVDEAQHRPQHLTAASLEISMKLRNILISSAIAALGVSAWAQAPTTDTNAKPTAPAVTGAASVKAPVATPAPTKTEKPVAVKKVHKKKLHKASHKRVVKDTKKESTGTAQ